MPLNYDLRHWSWRNERCVEVAIAKRVMHSRPSATVLELGNVLAVAGVTGHTVVDKYEVAPAIINQDILDFETDRSFDLGISISTLEHVGFDEHPQDFGKAARALAHFASLADGLLVTIPVGYHRAFETEFLSGPFDEIELIVKTSRRAGWTPSPLKDVDRFEYNAPFAHGNAILVGSRGLRHA